MGHGLDDNAYVASRVTALTDAVVNIDAVASKLHHKGNVDGDDDTIGSELDNGKPTKQLGLHDKIILCIDLLRIGENLNVVHVVEKVNLTRDRADSLDDVANTGLTLGAYHSVTFTDVTEGLNEIVLAANEGNTEIVLIDMVLVANGDKDIRLIGLVNSDGLENEVFDKVANAG